LKNDLEGALGGADRRTRLMAEIKTFLVMMKAAENTTVLNEITELTRTFDGYGGWTIDALIKEINQMKAAGDFSVAMPPEATMQYMRTAWEMRPALTDKDKPGDVILGLTRTGGPKNRWKNLAHYVYQNAAGRVFSWGEQFDSLADVNKKKKRDYSVIYRIMVHG
jgi:hypothetical protein